MKKIRLCRANEIAPSAMKSYDTEQGVKVLVINAGDSYYAYQGLCPHQDVCLDEGYFDGATLTCHQHLWQWDVRTGEAVGLAEAPLQRYDVEHSDGEIFLVEGSAIKDSGLFKDISDKTLEALDAVAKRETYDGQNAIYDIGDPAEDIYVLESGRVEFVVGREDRTSLAGFILRKGEAFGWAGLLESHPRRIAKATCMEPSVVLRLNGAQVLDILKADPVSGFQVMRQLSLLIARHMTLAGEK